MADQTGKQLTALNALITGFTKGLPGGASTFLLRNTAYSQADLLTLLTGMQAPLAAVPAAALAHQEALKARTKIQPDAVSLVEDVTSALKGALGSTNAAGLAVYGVSVRKTPTPLTTEQKVARAAKAAATRKARGTLGPKQKSLIHGTVPAAPAPDAPAPAPATPAATPKGP